MTADFLWGSRAPSKRGPKAALTLEQIADTAIAIADAEGLAAVSMQRVATDLGYTKMSLYRYLPGKAELVALMAERALASAPPVPDGADWRATLAGWTRGILATYLEHPWALSATLGPRAIGPSELGLMERALTVLAGAPLTGGERLDVMVVLVGHARMVAEQATSRSAEAQLSAAIGSVIAQRGDQFPELAAAMADAAANGGQDQAFDFGLERILDGIEALLRSRR